MVVVAIFDIRKLLAAILKELRARPHVGALAASFLVLSSVGCISASPAAEKVRITSNPDVVRGCEFLGNVKATSGWGGPAGTGIGSNNTEVALREKTAKLGGNVVFVVASGVKATGEAYRCPAQAPNP